MTFIKIPHDDIDELDKDEMRYLIQQWEKLNKTTYRVCAAYMWVNVFFGVYGIAIILLNILSFSTELHTLLNIYPGLLAVCFAFLTAMIKGSERRGYTGTLIVCLLNTLSIALNYIYAVSVALSLIPLLFVLRSIVNLPMIEKLKQQKGYPYFTYTVADKFNPQIYLKDEELHPADDAYVPWNAFSDYEYIEGEKIMTTVKTKHRETIFEQDKFMNSCHASTVLPLNDGTVVAAWFGGTEEGHDDVTVWYAKRKSGLWSAPKKVFVTETLPHWNPVLFQKLDGTIMLYFKYGKPIRQWKTYVAYSTDGGETFRAPKELVPGDNSGGRGPVKNKNIRLKDGTVLAPASTEKISWRCFADISKDDGETFTPSNYVVRPNDNGLPVAMIQPTLWESDSGVHMLTRTNKGYIYRSDSKNGGRTWNKAYKTPYKNPNSGIDIARLDDGSLVLISNPVSQNWGYRAPLTLMRSTDDGNTFEEFIKLEPTEGDHEYSYPAIVAAGMKLYITYTYERKTIAYWELEIE